MQLFTARQPVGAQSPPTGRHAGVPDDLAAHCAARLAGYKRPAAIRVLDELPLNLSGKVATAALRELAAAEARGDTATAASLTDDYAYDGVQTCAADGLCATVCPVHIDTGDLVRRLRAEGNPDGLSWSQTAALGRLARGGPATTADLARAEGIKPQSMGSTMAALERDALAFTQVIKPGVSARRVVEEILVAVVGENETEALVADETLDRAVHCRHCRKPLPSRASRAAHCRRGCRRSRSR